MPRLNYPKITKGDAIAALLKQYSKELRFTKEWAVIREPHVHILSRFAKDGLMFFKQSNITPADYYHSVVGYYKKESKKDPLPVDKFSYLSDLQPYFDNLDELADKWKLKAPWATATLFISDLINLLKHKGFPDEIVIPMESLGLIYPWEAPSPPLKIEVSAWAIILNGRQTVQNEINKKLQEYESKIKAMGLHEYPSALDKHARWWFEHYIYRKKYREIAEEEYYPADKTYTPNEESVKRAVWKFTKLVDIKIK
jgi:hypothetical protein